MSENQISEADLWDKINDAWLRMDLTQRRIWENIKIHPCTWKKLRPSNNYHAFWVVALIGEIVIWYDYVEEEFYCSPYSTPGTISNTDYVAGGLENAVQVIINQLQQ